MNIFRFGWLELDWGFVKILGVEGFAWISESEQLVNHNFDQFTIFPQRAAAVPRNLIVRIIISASNVDKNHYLGKQELLYW